jgi:hypothetical protein
MAIALDGIRTGDPVVKKSAAPNIAVTCIGLTLMKMAWPRKERRSLFANIRVTPEIARSTFGEPRDEHLN